MKKRRQIKGFTLVELLATIVIISIVFGIGYSIVGNIISNTEDKTSLISQASIKESANLYSKENIGNITWKKLSDEDNYYTCVQVSELVNTGYLKEKQASDYLNKYVYLVKNPDNVILKETIDTDGSLCSGDSPGNIVKVPTAEEICNSNAEYTGNLQPVAMIPDGRKNEIEFNDSALKIEAGTYKVGVKLKNSNDVWDRKNNTKDTITMNCRIKKATPIIKFANGDGSEGEIGKPITTTVNSESVSGTLSVKSSNDKYATGKVVNGNKIDKGGNKDIEIKVLASRDIATQITINFTPDDKKNYKDTSIVYTIGKVEVQKVSSNNLSSYCKNPVYNGHEQILVNMPKESDGITFLNYVGTEATTYTITARLKYGYEWDGNDVTEENKKDDIKFSCRIKKVYTITYNGNGATSGTMNNQQCFEDEACKLNSNGFSKTGHSFAGWSTTSDGNKSYDNGANITLTSDITLYAKWTVNTYTITYNANGGTGAPSAQSYTYSDTGSINLSKTIPTRTGYTFGGWTWNGNTYSAGQAWNRNNAANYTLTAKWNVNVCHITYHANGGTMKSKHGTGYSIVNNKYVYKNSVLLVHSYAYGENGGYISENGLLNYNNEKALNTKRDNYHVNDNDEWYRAGHKSEKNYDQAHKYKIKTICPDIETGSQSVVMKVFWVKDVVNTESNDNTAPNCTRTSYSAGKSYDSVSGCKVYGDNCWDDSGGYTGFNCKCSTVVCS